MLIRNDMEFKEMLRQAPHKSIVCRGCTKQLTYPVVAVEDGELSILYHAACAMEVAFDVLNDVSVLLEQSPIVPGYEERVNAIMGVRDKV